MAFNATADDFNRMVLESDVPVLVDFWAEWCGPCKMIGPMIEEISNETDGRFRVVKVNVDQVRDIPTKYNITALPTLMIFRNGEVVQQFMGVQPKEKLMQALEAAAAA